jgi:hypothetical protein
MTNPESKDSAITADTLPLPPNLAWGSGADADRLIAAGTMGPHLTGPEGTQGEQGAQGPQGVAGETIPVGGVIPWAAAVAPTGYLICNGAAVLRSSYAALDTAIYVGDANNSNTAITFGYRCTNSDGSGRSTTGIYIVIPDLQGFIPVGVGTSVNGTDADGLSHQAESWYLARKKNDRGQRHVHSVSTYLIRPQPINGEYSGPGYQNSSDGTNPNTTGLPISDGSNGVQRDGNTTRSKGVGMNYIIKY